MEEDKRFNIFITHVPTGESLDFEPYIENFTDNYKSDWKTETVIGRMDNISTFIRTGRIISLSFNVVSDNKKDACLNYNKSTKLSNFLYPVYKQIKTAQKQKAKVANPIPNETVKPTVRNFYNASALATTLEQNLSLRDEVSIMSAPPIIKIKFSNLISDRYNDSGLYGYLDAFNFQPDKDLGYFLSDDDNVIIPKAYNVNFTFNVIHVDPRGWTIDNKLRS